MSIVIRAFPVTSATNLDNFANALKGEHREHIAAFYKGYGVAHESWHLQDTPTGPWVIALTVLDEIEESFSKYAATSEDFHVWFKDQVKAASGIDPNEMPMGLPTTQIFSWTDGERKESGLFAWASVPNPVSAPAYST